MSLGGPTPTIILAAYDSSAREVLACSTMEPSTGRFWFSSKGNGAFLSRFDYHSGKFNSLEGRQIHVNNKEGLKGSHVLVDVDHGFERPTNDSSKQMLYPEGRREISRLVEAEGGKVASFYTNGGHYALIAMGNPTIIGNITTAIGGPYDVSGIRHVIEAGGVATCYEILGRKLYSLDNSQDIERADVVISTNNHENLNNLEKVLNSAVTKN